MDPLLKVIDEFLTGGVAKWGPQVYMAVMWGACGLAVAEGAFMASAGPAKARFREMFMRSLPCGLGLAAAQLAAILAADRFGGFNLLSGPAGMYFLFALLLPVLWATGSVWAKRMAMPAKKRKWSQKNSVLLVAGMALLGVVLSLLLVTLVNVNVGAAVHELTGDNPDLAVAILVAWLLFNAPWQEELIFRHYLVPRLSAIGIRRWRPAATVLAVVITAFVFALGHGGHFDPAWPKLVQTFIWGLMLGGVRIWLGTGYAMALHLLFNLSAPLMAPFLST